MVYIIGSLRNPEVPVITKKLSENGIDAFSEWYCGGERADDSWKEYQQFMGRTFMDALKGSYSKVAFNYDKEHLDKCNAAVLINPAGKSAHLELGYIIGQGKPGYVLLDPNVERWDIMLHFAAGVFTSVDDLLAELKRAKLS